MFKEIHKGGLVYMTAPNIPFTHAFTTRFGGVSGGIFESLNLGENRGDEPEAVRENYRRLKAALGIERLCFTKQVHEAAVKYVTGRDAREPFDPLPYACDGLVTDEPGVGLIAFTADCVPILLCDPERRVAAAVHAGWRGTVADIAGEAVKAMEALGCDPVNIQAAIGPCISRCCFETGPEVPEAVMAVLGKEGREYIDDPGRNEDKFFVDLKGVNRALLIRAGVRPESVAVSDECTVCESEKYWSHRATGGRRGAQAAVIALS